MSKKKKKDIVDEDMDLVNMEEKVVKEVIQITEIDEMDDDSEIEADLTGPEYSFSSKNQIQLEKKEDMKKRGLASPDLGDTLAMSFCAIVASKTIEERDREKLVAAGSVQERALLQFKLTMERDARERQGEERRPSHWE